MEEQIIQETVPEPIPVIVPKVPKMKIKKIMRRKRKVNPKPEVQMKPVSQEVSLMDIPEKKPITKPWQPASLLTVTGKEDGFRYRWVRKDLLEKRIAEGWEPVVENAKSRVQTPEDTIVDGKPLSTYKVKRNMILCRMPEEMALSRQTYYDRLTDSSVKAVTQEFASQTVMPDGSQMGYGEVKRG